MAHIVLEVVGRVAIEVLASAVASGIQASFRQNGSNNSNSSSRASRRSLPPVPASVSSKNNRAVLISSSNITFGNDCERLVNIAFETSQTFPTLMGTYTDVIQYLRKELAKQHPKEQFHIVIMESTSFGFAVSDDEYYAEIQQDRYYVLIFTTKSNSQIKFDNHDVNSQTRFVWN